MAARYVNVDRQTPMLLPPDLRDWVAGNDLVQLVVDAVGQCDLSGAQHNARGSGSEQYPPSLMVGLLIYSYATGVFSSRRIERSSYESVAVRYLCGNHHPDHDTIAKFRRENGVLFKKCFVEVLLLAREMGLVKVGTVSLDGTRLAGAGSKSSVLGLEQIETELKHLADRAAELAEEADRVDRDGEGTLLPAEFSDVERRRALLQRAKEEIEARRQKAREEGRREGPGSEHRTRRASVSEPESRTLCRRGKSSVQGYNAQAVADAEGSGLIIGAHLSDEVSDNRLLEAGLQAVAGELGEPKVVLVDKGYENSVMAERIESERGIAVLCPPQERPRASGKPPHQARRQQSAAWRKRMMERMSQPRWRRLYRRRLPSAEGVFARIKGHMGFGRFRCWGRSAASAEWTLVCLAHNVRLLAGRGVRIAP